MRVTDISVPSISAEISSTEDCSNSSNKILTAILVVLVLGIADEDDEEEEEVVVVVVAAAAILVVLIFGIAGEFVFVVAVIVSRGVWG